MPTSHAAPHALSANAYSYAAPGVVRHPSTVHEDLWSAVDEKGKPTLSIPLQKVTLFNVPGKSMHLSFSFASSTACASFRQSLAMQNIVKPEIAQLGGATKDFVCTLADITNVRGMIALCAQHGIMSDVQSHGFGKSVRRAYSVYGR